MKKLSYLFIAIIVLAAYPVVLVKAQNGGIAVNGAGVPPDSSALLDVSSTIKGELMPRMTTAQRNAIVKPAFGLTIFNTDCGVFNFNAGTPGAPNWATLNSSNAVIAGVSIFASPAGAICEGSGTIVTFTALPASGIISPTYQWRLNGANVGTNSSTYSNPSLNNGDVVNCILTTNQACASGSPATSSPVVMVVDSTSPGDLGNISGPSAYCPGQLGVIYSIAPIPSASPDEYYLWSVPGDANIVSGQGTDSITVNMGSSSGQTIGVYAGNVCGTGNQQNLTVNVSGAPGNPGSIGGISVVSDSQSVSYAVSPDANTAFYNWTVFSGATIASGQGTDSISVNFTNTSGNICVTDSNSCGFSNSITQCTAVNVSSGCPAHATVTFICVEGIQTFTVPSCVNSLTIQAYGAQGGAGGLPGGEGAMMQGDFSLTPGQQLNILAGQTGVTNLSASGGGGGGTFVILNGNPLIVAGGGGGGGNSYSGGPGLTTTSAGSSTGSYPAGGGTANSGGAASSYGYGGAGGGGGICCDGASINTGGGLGSDGGAGYTGNGGAGQNGAVNAYSYVNGGYGGYQPSYNNASATYGGFGGGGNGISYAYQAGGGGGGGYSGGGGGAGYGIGGGGGGGGSYNTGTNQNNQQGVQSGNGQVIITW